MFTKHQDQPYVAYKSSVIWKKDFLARLGIPIFNMKHARSPKFK